MARFGLELGKGDRRSGRAVDRTMPALPRSMADIGMLKCAALLALSASTRP
jgi:hypothetical protein